MGATQTIGAVVVLLLAVYGCAQLVRWVALRLLTPPKGINGIWIVPLFGHREDAEYLIRSASTYRRWNGRFGSEMCLLDIGMDDETARLVRRLCAEKTGVQVLNVEELPAFFNERQK